MRVFSSELPSSLDPLSFDLSKHHPFQSIVHIKLATQYPGQGIYPQLASSWRSERSEKVWRFTIRDDIRFSDGTSVTPDIVVDSLKRTIYKLKISHSKHKIISRIVGIEGLDSPRGFLDGLVAEGDEIVFRFNDSYVNFPEALSFGVFAISSPRDFDGNTGEWLKENILDSVGAGPYQVLSVDKESIVLEIKENYPKELLSNRPHQRIIFFSDSEKIQDADLASLSSDDRRLEKTHAFHGRRAMHTLYFLCHGWRNHGSPLYEKYVREQLRSGFKDAMNDGGRSVPDTFFPPVMPGVSAVDVHPVQNLIHHQSRVLRVLDLRGGQSKLVNAALEALETSIQKAGFGIAWVPRKSHEEIKRQLDPSLPSHAFDIGLYATGMSLDDITADVRLMFSKEGVWLPDEDGSIHGELKKNQPNVQTINKLLFSQALIWSVAHYSIGSWVSKGLDLKEYNTLLPLGELQWIGVK